MSQMRIVVGLGNPGEKFSDTRHNIGFKVIDMLAEALTIDVKSRKFGAYLGTGRFVDKELLLLKPRQFMNRSGEAVAKAVWFYKMAISELLVVTDDMALPPGRIRIRAKGSAGGHKGLVDVIDKLGSNQFGRLRIGIGAPPVHPGRQEDAIDYVLSRPKRGEKPLLDKAISRAKDAVLCWAELGIEAAMNRFNRIDISS